MSTTSFGGEALLSHKLPNYELERIVLSVLVGASIVFWFIIFPQLVESLRKNNKTTTRKKRETITIRVSSNGSRRSTSTTTRSESTKDPKEPQQSNSNNNIIAVISVIACLVTTVCLLLSSSNNTLVGRGIFEAPLFTQDECQSILDRSYAAAARNMESLLDDNNNNNNKTASSLLFLLKQEPQGWQKERHKLHPTIDLNVVTDAFQKEDRQFLATIMDQRLAPLLKRIYGISIKSIRANDMFIVRYTPETMSALSKHTDQGDLSINILLNDEFKGGGTQFWNRLTGLPLKIEPQAVGQVLMHSALLQHEGLAITKGVRHVLVGFLAVDRLAPFALEPSGLSWFASWLSVPHLHVKFKEGYVAARSRRSKGKAAARWTDHPVVRSLFRDIVTTVEYVGDLVSPHRHYNLVHPDKAREFIQRLDDDVAVKSEASWFAGQQLNIDFDGTVASEWDTRQERSDEFVDL